MASAPLHRPRPDASSEELREALETLRHALLVSDGLCVTDDPNAAIDALRSGTPVEDVWEHYFWRLDHRALIEAADRLLGAPRSELNRLH